MSVFVDMGSGKGRALLVASEFPFAEIVVSNYRASHMKWRKTISSDIGLRRSGAGDSSCIA
jgi:hypothetical protein